MNNIEIQKSPLVTLMPSTEVTSITKVNVENILVDENATVIEGSTDSKIVQYQAWVDENGNGLLDANEGPQGNFTDSMGKSTLDILFLNPEDQICAQQLSWSSTLIPQIDRECEVIGEDFVVDLAFKNMVMSPTPTISPTSEPTHTPVVTTQQPIEFPNTGGMPEDEVGFSPAIVLGLALASIGAVTLKVLTKSRN